MTQRVGILQNQNQYIMSEIILIPNPDGTISQFTVEKTVIDINAMKEEREALLAQQQAAEPSDEELIAWARIMHPFYQENIALEMRIQDLNNSINEFNSF